MYSLVSMPVLCFDLVRDDHGTEVARLLRRALGLTASDLAPLVEGYTPRRGAQEPPETTAEPATAARGDVATRLRRSADLVADGQAAEALLVLQRVTLLGTDVLLHVVRHDLLGWVWELSPPRRERGLRAADLVGDAVVAALAGQQCEATERLLALGDPPVHSLGPNAVTVAAVLERLTELDDEGRNRVRDAAGPRGGGWAAAMHSATWAVHLADRHRTATAAQLLAIEALQAGGFDRADLAAGVWNLVSGAVQALVVEDLLDEPTRARLTGPLLAALASPRP